MVSAFRRSSPSTLARGEVTEGEAPPGVELGVGAGVADEFGAVVLGAEASAPAEEGGAADKPPLRVTNVIRLSRTYPSGQAPRYVHNETSGNLRSTSCCCSTDNPKASKDMLESIMAAIAWEILFGENIRYVQATSMTRC